MTPSQPQASASLKEWPLWEVFVRSKQGIEHKHCGSLHAADAQQALQMARDVYTSDPQDKDMLFEPAVDKIYRHPTFFVIPDEVGHM